MQIESDLIFVGLLVMQNGLKPETAPVIRCLHNANIRTVMITGRWRQAKVEKKSFDDLTFLLGDNIYTAISVARDCDMISKTSEVLLVKIENEESQVIPKMYTEHFGSTKRSNEIAVSFNENVQFKYLFLMRLIVINFSIYILQLMVKHGAN